ncbi:MAG: leucine-rich repeat domain-containing protein, partial [Kiritimatiellae bacterium]|nr:leucine-rich repeat domain-containing protein [Kiritimatiellia bacterium]
MNPTASRLTRSPRFPRLCTLALVCLVLLLPLVLPAATEGPYTYTVTNGQATITGFDSSCSGALSITNELGGCPVTTIGDRAFYKRTNLTSVSVPDDVTSIGIATFYGCSSLASITIPGSITNIGDYAFGGCSALTSITVSENNLNYASNNGILFNKTLSTLITCPRGVSGHVTIPDGVTSIGDFAFFGCPALTSVTIPDSITYIGRAAFAGCPVLHTVVLGSSLDNIGNWAFC